MKLASNLEEAMQKMKEVSDEIKSMSKKYKISKRARKVRKLIGVIKAHDNKFTVSRFNRKVGHSKHITEQEKMFNLLMSKAKLQGYITAKLEMVGEVKYGN